MRSAAVALALAVVGGSAAWAQGSASDIQADEPRPQETPRLLEQETLTGEWGTLRPQLAERGVALGFTYYGEAFSNLAGGLDTGTRYESLFEGELNADLEKLAGWSGGLFHVIGFWIEGDGLSEKHVGDFTKVSNNDAEDTIRVFDLWLEQTLLEGGLSIRAGLLCADQELATSDYGCLFLNGTLGMPVGLSLNVPITAYPLAAPAVRVRGDLGPFYLQAAVFDGDPGSEEFNDTGFRVRLKDAEGTLTVVEAGASTGDVVGLPGTIKLGAFLHSGEFPEHDASGTERRNYGLYAVYDQMVYREPSEDPNGEQGLGLFGRAVAAPRDRNLLSVYFDAGVHYTGLFPGRDDDRFGIAFVYARLSPEFVDAQADPSEWDREMAIELTYRMRLTKWFHLQPDVQYIFHPGGTSSVDDALVAGVRFEVTF